MLAFTTILFALLPGCISAIQILYYVNYASPESGYHTLQSHGHLPDNLIHNFIANYGTWTANHYRCYQYDHQLVISNTYQANSRAEAQRMVAEMKAHTLAHS